MPSKGVAVIKSVHAYCTCIIQFSHSFSYLFSLSTQPLYIPLKHLFCLLDFSPTSLSMKGSLLHKFVAKKEINVK